MFVCRDYDEEKKLDRVWYKSTNVIYSECDDNKDALKTLRVTFTNGATYEYYDVDVMDYLMFMRGGVDGSNGKALNKFIKPKYKWKKLSPLNPVNIEIEKNQFLASKKQQETPQNQD